MGLALEFDAHNLQKIKLGVHIAQAVLIFVTWAMEIAVFHDAESIDGRAGWYFGLCFLCIPAIIYLTMTPRFPRTRKFAHPYGLATVDCLFAVLWISAFAAQASYNSSGKCNGACGISKAIVGFGVFIWYFPPYFFLPVGQQADGSINRLLWCATAFMSFYGVAYYRREGYLPGASRAPFNAQAIDPDKEAFSTAPHDDEYAPVHNTDDHEAAGSSYAGASTVGSAYNPDSAYSGYVAPHIADEPSGYQGYSGSGSINSAGGRLNFPEARYDNV
ncbi:uncharacterized protein LY89DRAFT_731009 [Mollisia scopiformis]|uniref:MARVEL domain-containing protein n=1 Tax=Mollisia scopiformis TaxID=149040 RepID=A0A194XHW7_MOLSC|nr:uncharacterized protein LY89DRAFT_731009 [Mollisia scopiformis]KUJ19753.1 hypothetical protein LY89DRAFT_731009 [Mollisia scopiformis]